MLIRDETALDAVARYFHLNPVRIRGLGLPKADQRRSRELGCADPGAHRVVRRLSVLREHRWNSWRVYAGLESAPGWLTRERIHFGGDCAGR